MILLLTSSQGLNLQPPDDCLFRSLGNQHLQPLHHVLDNSEWIFGTYKLNVLTWIELLPLCMIFYLCSYSIFFFSFNNTGILSTCNGIRTGDPVDSIKDAVWSSVKVPEFDKHLKKAGGHIGWNVVEITIKMKKIVWKPLMIKIIKVCLRNFDNQKLFNLTKIFVLSFQ